MIKKISFLLLAFTLITPLTKGGVYSGGNGDAGNPYQIATTDDLIELSNTFGDWGAYFIQTADIAFNPDENQVDWNGNGSPGPVEGFWPIGNSSTSFTGDYNGNDYIISNLFINRTTNRVGLFGYVYDNNTIDNLGLINVDITGNEKVGALIGDINTGSVSSCYSTGSVSGSSYVGGLIGYAAYISLSDSYSSCTVTGTLYEIGGLVGINNLGDIITRSYSTGNVSGDKYVGGFVGNNYQSATVSNCYSTGSVTRNSGSTETNFGGFCGSNTLSTIEYCYSTGDVIYDGADNPTDKNFVGYDGAGNYSDNFFYKRNNDETGTGATGLSEVEMQNQSSFTNWDFVDTWAMSSSITFNGYPTLQWTGAYAEAPTSSQIASLPNLVWIAEDNNNWSGTYTQTADINAWTTPSWDDNQGWTPIGNGTNNFTGSYDGGVYIIDNLYINRPSTEYIALFGKTGAATITNIGVTNVDITGESYIGGLVGWHGSGGTVSNSYTSGSVHGERDGTIGGNNVGGIIGYNNGGTISNSYSTASVSGYATIGGLVGDNYGGTIEKCYATGLVSGTDADIGGLVGNSHGGYDVNDSFWDTQTSGQSSSDGGTGKTTAEMQRATTFLDAGWDFTLSGDVWAMNQDVNSGYPFLRMQGETPAHVWLGTSGTSWSTIGDWSENSTPGSTNNVIVPNVTNDPAISNDPSSPALSNKLTIEPAAVLTVSAGDALTVNSDLSNSGTLSINSSLSGTGSLIINGTASGNITVQRYIAELTRADAWHYVSASVSGQALNDTWMIANNISTYNNQYQFYRWDEDTDYWIYYGSTGDPEAFNDTEFMDARAYSLTASGTQTLSFTGTAITSNTNYAATYTENKGWGWNLVGNPFASTIAITAGAQVTDNFLADNAAIIPDSYEAIYVWDEQSAYTYGENDYKVICNTDFSGDIPPNGEIDQDYVTPGQGFMVKVNTTGNIVFNEDIRKHATASFYKEDDSWPGLELGVAGNDQVNSTIVAFQENMTKGLDPSYDAAKLKGNPDLALYTKLIEDNGKDFAIQALPYFEEEYSIPVGIDISEEGSYTFEVVSMEQIPEDVHVYLEDLKTGTVTNLKEINAYTCILDETGSITDRFVLHFTLTAFGEEELQANESPIQIWANNETINLYNPDQLEGTIKIFNLYGQQIMQTKLNGNQQQQVNIEVPAAYYLVNVISKEDAVSKKVFVY
ncbi:MAG: T9SS type A sorting domain-containing protein [Bacteroidales bacterium]|nr:T9SS type A sorting domain-containing protein [Bacteroidales bacterium]MCF8345403.1 T9SS type A sorting domain-containing protein [Bacteroidales bacterium]MCF8352519.1 T9SS type A sorting domain-containing protein [Bacteroidales bacterium]